MSRRRKNALKRRRRAAPEPPEAPRLTLVPPLAPRAAEDALDTARDDAWPILPAPGRRRHTPWAGFLHNNRRLLYAAAATLVGVIVLLILRWIEASERMRPFVAPPTSG